MTGRRSIALALIAAINAACLIWVGGVRVDGIGNWAVHAVACYVLAHVSTEARVACAGG